MRKQKINHTFALAKQSIGLWCNGNTTDSGPVILGSNPGSPTSKDCHLTVFFRFGLPGFGQRVAVWQSHLQVEIAIIVAQLR